MEVYILFHRFLLSPVLVMLVFDPVLHGVGLVVDQLSGVPGDVVLEHVLALHVLKLHPGHFVFGL